ncbi:MAG: nicotinate-nucleotide--dimethylbenzimidazole phosphoribosyltransferase, partial [Lachnospiraceae bacterium]|nr:nicotinate-nucleotide--dimethylbenzimidazole phosphoribosyltransferase [Lachnospiraceae bacterium]
MNSIDIEFLSNLKVSKTDEKAYRQAKGIIDKIAKPLDGLGVFEDSIARIASIKGSTDVSIK